MHWRDFLIGLGMFAAMAVGILVVMFVADEREGDND